MRNNLLVAFILYPFIVNLISVVAGASLMFLLLILRRRRHGKASK